MPLVPLALTSEPAAGASSSPCTGCRHRGRRRARSRSVPASPHRRGHPRIHPGREAPEKENASHDAHCSVVHLRHRPAVGARQRAPTTATPTRRRSPTSSLAAARRRADLVVMRILGSPAVHPQRAGRSPGVRAARWSCSAASRLPDASLMELSTVPIGIAAEAHLYLAQGGTGQPAPSCTPSSPTPCCSPARVRAAGRAAGLGRVLPRPRAASAAGAAAGRHRLLPGPVHRRQHRVRRGAGRRRRRGRRRRGADLRHVTARRPGRPARPPRHAGCPGHHRAGRGRHQAGHRRAPAGTTRPGTSAPWPPSTSRSCKGSA